MTQLYIDLDGVLADFDRHYIQMFGELPAKWKTDHDHTNNNLDVDWKSMNDRDFFAGIPLMRDAMELWEYVSKYNPIILTGCPKTGFDNAAANKRAWVVTHIGPNVPVITCFSKEKCDYAQPGDILVDDWEKYKEKWVGKGGLWITHNSAKESIYELQKLKRWDC